MGSSVSESQLEPPISSSLRMTAVFGILTLLICSSMGQSLDEQFDNFVKKFNKTYRTRSEFALRRAIFEETVDLINRHNARNFSYTMGINEFSDLTDDEFRSFYLMEGYEIPDTSNLTFFKEDRQVRSPSSLDYRDEGMVTAVKNQGQCGSCWAFSATGALEGMWKKTRGNLISMSEQQMVDCGQGGCNGGWMHWGWETVRNGIESESSYPYTARDGSCHANSNNFVATNSGHQFVSQGESSLENALVQVGHPISVAVHVNMNFRHYNGGVFSDPECQNYQVNHAVLAVGYDKTSGTPHWIVKNSWGGGWGSRGYILMKIGENSCGISNIPMYPTP